MSKPPKTFICPACRVHFADVAIRGGALRCPSCDIRLFQFVRPGDDPAMTPAQFMQLIDTRGIELGQAARRWMRGGALKTLIASGVFVSFIWPHLASTLEGKDGSQTAEPG
jgi:DNA-directed RNA polymerase subunit RPC12/RpoP